MSHLHTLLADPSALVARLKLGALEPTELRRAVTRLGGQSAEGDDTMEHVAILQTRIIAAAEQGVLSRLSRRDVREGCKAFFSDPSPLASHAVAAAGLVGEVGRLQRRAAFFALIDAYLDAFDPGNGDFLALAERLTDMSDRWPWRPADTWPARIRAFALFDPARAPTRLANAILDGDGSAREVFEQAGLITVGRANGGLAEAAFRNACEMVGALRGDRAVAGQTTLIEWARDDRGQFNFPRAWPEFVTASLAPWEAVEPAEAHKSALLMMLESYGGGDPRAKPGKWRTVMDQSPGAYAVLLRWLTRASVLQFLDIVDRSMPDAEAKLMWSYRRAFWTSYLMGDGSGPKIDAAWVAFGSHGAQLARHSARQTGDQSFSAFGLQNDRSADQSALIIQIGDLLIVDWSHSAKYNVWRKGDKRQPVLFKQHYAAGELYSAPLQDNHSSPRTYTWQRKLARVIEGKIFFSEKPNWRPRRA